ncbi:MAG: hypothetical protein RLY83_203 [Actinomycetota bacterium]|jgi:hypothetical protein
MFSLLYKKLPGGKVAKMAQMVTIILAFVAVLFFVVFPAVDPLIPEDPSING